jgi:hypothetical protein
MVFMRELGITFQFVPNNFNIMYYDPETDPFDGEYNDKRGEVIDANIGDANYDIGHNFNTQKTVVMQDVLVVFVLLEVKEVV